MSNFCLIAASLVSQGQAPGWQMAVPPAALPTQMPPVASKAIAHLCDPKSDTYRPTNPIAEAQFPEFDQQWQLRPALALRPISGSQLFQQRWAALRIGKLYTHVAADSFQSAWMNATTPPTYQQWVSLLKRESEVMAQSQGNNRLSVLLGDSLALWFPIERLSSDRYWLNQGISGDTTTGILNRLPLLDNIHPDTIHIMAGINDLRQGATDATVISNLLQIIRQLKRSHPEATLYVYSILPTRLPAIPSNRVRWLNYNIAAAARKEGVDFLNLQPAFSDDRGNLRRDLTTDGLHLSHLGYKVWQTALQPIF
ncbi:MAG TPA: GDSL-type esterase/lipase family protein [Coleofasciculaceae cyanobacterium]